MLQSLKQRLGLRVNSIVFFSSAFLIALFVVLGAAFTESASALFETVQSGIVTYAGWFYILSVAVFLVFVIGLALSRYGGIKLGPDDSEPDYSYASWIAMLFSAGMGIGIMFYSVAEPILHYANPPVGSGESVDAAREAMQITFFHWGLHAWAIYIVVGLSLAYFAYRHGLPLTIRSSLYPIIGDRIYGPIGHAVDVLAVLGTMFGVATSLGLGVMQINAGLGHVFGVPTGINTQLVLIAGITVLAAISVFLGLDVGIRRLSELNLGLGLLLVLFVAAVGPTIFLIDSFVQNLGGYVQNVATMTFETYAYQENGWMSSWTLFYWAWWIAWSPFVGMFIARISRGRTIREFIVGVLCVPTLVTFIWLTVFGQTALHLELFEATGIVGAVEQDIDTALFVTLAEFPLATFTSVIATIIVMTFFVTSSDSGSLVIDIITSGGDTDPPAKQRVFWAVAEGAVASVLLVAGGLSALQTASLTTALPFAAVLLVMCYGLWRGLRADRLDDDDQARDVLPSNRDGRPIRAGTRPDGTDAKPEPEGVPSS